MGVHSVFVGKVIPPSDESEGYRVEKLDLNTGESSGNDDIQEFLSLLNGEQVFVAISDVHHSLPQTASDLRSAIHWYEQNPRALRNELDEKERQVGVLDIFSRDQEQCGFCKFGSILISFGLGILFGASMGVSSGYMLADPCLMRSGGISFVFGLIILGCGIYFKRRGEVLPQSG